VNTYLPFLVLMLLAGGGQSLRAEDVHNACCGRFRTLDTISGRVTDLEVRAGETWQLGPLTILLRECRYQVGQPAGESFASLLVTENGREEPVFEGWMLSAHPALSAMDHHRYDVWLIRCTTSDPESAGD